MADVKLDPADPTDRRIIARQQQAARQAGREGRDRAATTRGRADLEAAYDQGAAEARDENDDQGDEEQGDAPERPTARARVRAGGRAAARGVKATARAANKAGRPLSRGRWRPTLRPPTRARDAGSLLTGMLLYTAVITYVRYGPDGWKGWLSAKFLNKPLDGGNPDGMKEDGVR